MSNIVPSPSAALPIPPPAGVDRAVRYLSNKLVAVAGGHELPLVEAPTAEQRQGLERRLSRLAGWLAPFGIDQVQTVRDELSALLGTRKGSVTVADAAVLLEVYVQDLRDLPLHAIQAACRDFRQGRVPGDEGYRPTQGMIRGQAQRHLHELALEQRRIQAILDARLVEGRRPPDDVRRASAAAARRTFGIPEGGSKPSALPHDAHDGPDTLGETARDLLLRSSLDAWRRRRAEASGADYPEDRFASQDAAE